MQGNEKLIRSLKDRAISGTLTGAFLLCGPKGIGKATVAKTLGRTVLCRGTKDSSCTCRQCLTTLPKSPDAILAEPNQFGNILSGTMKNAAALFGEESPTGSKQRVLIVDGVENIHHSAVDDLLKTMESLKGGDLVILVSSNLSSVNKTVTSRTNIIRFKGLTRGEYQQALAEKGTKASWAQELTRTAHSLSLGVLTTTQVYKDGAEISGKIFKSMQALDLGKCLTSVSKVQDNELCLAVLETLLTRVTDAQASRGGAHQFVSFGAQEEGVSDYQEEFSLPVSDLLRIAIMDIRKGAPGRTRLIQAVNGCVAATATVMQHAKRMGNNASV